MTNLERIYLLHIFFIFPFSIIGTIRHLIRHYKYYRIRGATHLKEINPSHLKPFFRICEVTIEWGKHALFTGFKRRILRRLLKREPVHDFHGQYMIRCVK